MRILTVLALLSTAVLSAVTFDLPDVTLSKPWRSKEFTTSNGETVKVSFTAVGNGSAAGLISTNSSRSTYRKFSVTPGKNTHSITFPDDNNLVRLFIVNLMPQKDSKLVIKDFKVEIADKIRFGNFEKVRVSKRGCTGWTSDPSCVFRVEKGKVVGRLKGETFSWFKQWVYLPADTVFTLSADVKAQNFKGNAGFELVFRGGGKGFNKTIQHMPVTRDTNGVKRIYFTFKTPSKLQYCAMRLAAIKASGLLEFDNVELTPGAFIPQVPVSEDFSAKLTFDGFFKYNRSGFKWETAPELTQVSLATDNKELVISGICKSTSDARRLIQGGAVSINDVKVADVNAALTADDFAAGSITLRAGKKNFRKVVLK